jgi:hypothetical protein
MARSNVGNNLVASFARARRTKYATRYLQGLAVGEAETRPRLRFAGARMFPRWRRDPRAIQIKTRG